MNDNNNSEFELAVKTVDDLTDKERLGILLHLIETGVQITTAFVRADDSDVFTHQVVRIECGDYATVSSPEPLEAPLRPATGAEVGATVN